jgi:nitrogen fixation protein NifU and related proteins
MSELRDLYQELILDHGRKPRNFKEMPAANRIKQGFNPLCGDRLTLFVKIENDAINDITFQGCGCAISMASASLMTDYLKGKTISEAKVIFHAFHEMVTSQDASKEPENLGKLKVLKGVSEFPARVKCATLSWHTLIAALENNPENVSTE